MPKELISAVISQNTELWKIPGAGVSPDNPVAARIQAGKLLRIMGVCSVESPAQLSALLNIIGDNVDVLRAPGKKPRTRPVSPQGELLFKGVGLEEAMSVYAEIVKKFPQILFASEVMSGNDLRLLAPFLALPWTGSREQSQETLFGIGQAAAEHKLPVMTKNPLPADLELLLGMLENGILGAAQLVPYLLCLRGNTPDAETDTKIYRNKPNLEWIKVVKKAFPNLPVIIDPSHLFKPDSLTPKNVAETIQQGVDEGADGYILELNTPEFPSKTDPGTDAAQTLELLAKHNLV